jgi:hypothetical protein
VSLYEIVPERFHLASDDYEELWDAILDHPSPEKALDGDPYLHSQTFNVSRPTVYRTLANNSR